MKNVIVLVLWLISSNPTKAQDIVLNYFDLSFRNGIAYTGEYGEHKFSGKAFIYYLSGEPQSMITYLEGQTKGDYKEWYEGGKMKLHGTYKIGQVLDGPFCEWFESGHKKLDGNYRDGFKSGIWTEYYPNGQPYSKGRYLLGAKEGKWEYWYESGKRFRIEEFSKGRRLKMNGKPVIEEHEEQDSTFVK